MSANPKEVDEYIAQGCGRCAYGGTPKCKVRSWADELQLLRKIILSSDLIEEIKWGAPCYTYEGKNILMLSALKESVVVSFFRGALLTDPDQLLEKPGKNSRFARYIRFKDVDSVTLLKPALFTFIKEAITVRNSQQQINEDVDSQLTYPMELLQKFEEDPAFESAFYALTPGRQRGYLIYFSSAKQSKTRSSRIEKSIPKIFAGIGWNEYTKG